LDSSGGKDVIIGYGFSMGVGLFDTLGVVFGRMLGISMFGGQTCTAMDMMKDTFVAKQAKVERGTTHMGKPIMMIMVVVGPMK